MYLDNAATTKIHPLVKKEMNNISYANYNALYYEEAMDVKVKINSAISTVAEKLNVSEKSIVFTSGATESNNYIIKGIALKFPKAHYITSTIEHKSILETFKYLESIGCDVTYIKPNANGYITKDAIECEIKSTTMLVSIIHVNNETGIINDIKTISKFLKEKKILFHTDAVQALGKVDFDYSIIDYISISGHKIFGPKGIGIAIVNNKQPLPLLHGSNQQNGNRAGTLPNELIVGISKAIEIAIDNIKDNNEKIYEMRKELLSVLKSEFNDDLTINFEQCKTVHNILSIQIKDEINNIFLENNKEVFKASTGSSCSISLPSYVLREHGFSNKEIKQTIRISFSPYDELQF